MRWGHRNEPPPPRNVRVEHADGTSTLCVVIYTGIVDGMHEWEATAPCEFGATDRLVMDMIPPRTGLRMTVARGHE